ncbi:tyrosine-protein kinase STYK1 [Falco biarmicus]|uniref:tyrosine-protein kinase STYK1 n=1 Tax=Falco rusticolus TaxID=120794 RepID=UPI000392F010|nr:tyrosine-protein kinase STYK1 [Falco rusticolus]XP_037245142.1 tyrosine-protein kinase STYK1 [Falco rusticolus]XP_037245144.1 tyrosine-protein kinase STYK1 [Falco rusticolus]XP_037245145.1 tyrosine-protein kinase STYK1 [Falco rusticolus]XP_037245146.1 tyrosine-protein kinase STYK1 [Falco rusticolus]XP_037245147.1 tyrosine-protein kinase STYK1 [Falco rusticolus]XP_037245148.1 tyrosine-protein kinase STYK1 [Falco rusticolus]XP_037245150.1 tyrosine-protein kinase STYK1 [Falco rusticolus]XP_
MAGDVKRFTRMLLECNSNDKLCVLREYQTEVIVVPVLLVGFFVIVLTVILWLHCRGLRAKQEQSSSSGHQVNDKNHEESSSTENHYIQLTETSVEGLLNSASLTLKELEIPREKLLLGTLQLIKPGCYGSIYRAQLATGSPGKTRTVVLKALEEVASPQKVKDFLGRIKFHQNLGRHENLVELIGCCVNQLPLYMIMEDVSLGDLLTFLWTCRKDVVTMDGIPCDLTERQVYEVGQQVAAALAYLEQKKLFHGDIAARNVLLHRNFTAKLCSLGLAYEAQTYGANSVTQIVPVKWQAPERLLKKPFSIKADIWSFGILLYEMITLGAPPYPEVPPSDILSYLQRQNIMRQPSSCQKAMYNIMKSCWRWNATKRPSPADLIWSLQTAIKTSNGCAVLQVPELVVPELYADVAGVDVYSLVREYTIL